MIWIPFFFIVILLIILMVSTNIWQYKVGNVYVAGIFTFLFKLCIIALLYVSYLLFTQETTVKQVIQTFGGF